LASPLDKILFQNKYLAVIDRDGYIFSREVRCDGKIISVLPFRNRANGMEFLARQEICPAHGPELELCSITGGVEAGESIQQAAKEELLEEAGYEVNLDELINLGVAQPSKSADTTVYLFAVDISEKTQMVAKGDGTPLEASGSVQWVDHGQAIQITDPLIVTAVVRLMQLMKI
jgi:8-oxo-dGTP pyrophosphatase MutT (NUDIX family)